MQELLQEILDFLQANNLDNFLTSLIISILGVIIAFVRTGKKTIQKKAGYVNLNNVHLKDYVVIYDNKIIAFDKLTIRKKSSITKLDLQKLDDVGGVFNDS